MAEMLGIILKIKASRLEEEFNRLSQKGSVDEYVEQFEDLRVQMLNHNPTLGDAYFLSSFTNGLKVEILVAIRLFRPTTLNQAIELARTQERAIEKVRKRSEMVVKPSTSQLHSISVQEANQHTPNAEKFTNYPDGEMYTYGAHKLLDEMPEKVKSQEIPLCAFRFSKSMILPLIRIRQVSHMIFRMLDRLTVASLPHGLKREKKQSIVSCDPGGIVFDEMNQLKEAEIVTGASFHFTVHSLDYAKTHLAGQAVNEWMVKRFDGLLDIFKKNIIYDIASSKDSSLESFLFRWDIINSRVTSIPKSLTGIKVLNFEDVNEIVEEVMVNKNMTLACWPCVLRFNNKYYLHWKHLLMFKHLLEQHHSKQIAFILSCTMSAEAWVDKLLLIGSLKTWAMNYGPMIVLYYEFKIHVVKMKNRGGKRTNQRMHWKTFLDLVALAFEDFVTATPLVTWVMEVTHIEDFMFQLLNFPFKDCPNEGISNNALVGFGLLLQGGNELGITVFVKVLLDSVESEIKMQRDDLEMNKRMSLELPKQVPLLASQITISDYEIEIWDNELEMTTEKDEKLEEEVARLKHDCSKATTEITCYLVVQLENASFGQAIHLNYCHSHWHFCGCSNLPPEDATWGTMIS